MKKNIVIFRIFCFLCLCVVIGFGVYFILKRNCQCTMSTSSSLLKDPYHFAQERRIDNRINQMKFFSKTNLFWQYPVHTEKEFFEQNWALNDYLPVPWATIIDNFSYKSWSFVDVIRKYFPKENYFTCCQHIYMKKFLPIFKACHVTRIYTPHKIVNENMIDNIQLLPCPLFAVNFEDNCRNSEFRYVDFIYRKTKYLYSFKGAWDPTYISTIRQEIFSMPHPDDTVIENIGGWHFYEDVYGGMQTKKSQVDYSEEMRKRTSEYNALLLDSKFSLCPSGAGPNTIRFWESLAVGCIPILLSDTLELPEHKDWDKAIFKVPEKNVRNLGFLRNISDLEIIERRKKCIEIYNYFSDNYRSN